MVVVEDAKSQVNLLPLCSNPETKHLAADPPPDGNLNRNPDYSRPEPFDRP